MPSAMVKLPPMHDVLQAISAEAAVAIREEVKACLSHGKQGSSDKHSELVLALSHNASVIYGLTLIAAAIQDASGKADVKPKL